MAANATARGIAIERLSVSVEGNLDLSAFLGIAPGHAGFDSIRAEIARIEEGTAPSQIDRQDLSRIGTVSASVGPETSLAGASSEIQAAVDGIELPSGYSVVLGGETEQLEETTGYVIEAILLAVILIFLIY